MHGKQQQRVEQQQQRQHRRRFFFLSSAFFFEQQGILARRLVGAEGRRERAPVKAGGDLTRARGGCA